MEMSVAKDGEDGLNQALANHPDLILLDILMPKMNGLATLKKLREDDWGKTVPVILLTNLDPDDKAIDAVSEYDPSYYLIKSDNTPQDVLNKINEVLTNPAQTL